MPDINRCAATDRPRRGLRRGFIPRKRRTVYEPLGRIVGYTETGLSSLEGGASGKEMTSCVVAPSGTLHQK